MTLDTKIAITKFVGIICAMILMFGILPMAVDTFNN
jgi:hypothetical protein